MHVRLKSIIHKSRRLYLGWIMMQRQIVHALQDEDAGWGWFTVVMFLIIRVNPVISNSMLSMRSGVHSFSLSSTIQPMDLHLLCLPFHQPCRNQQKRKDPRVKRGSEARRRTTVILEGVQAHHPETRKAVGEAEVHHLWIDIVLESHPMRTAWMMGMLVVPK